MRTQGVRRFSVSPTVVQQYLLQQSVQVDAQIGSSSLVETSVFTVDQISFSSNQLKSIIDENCTFLSPHKNKGWTLDCDSFFEVQLLFFLFLFLVLFFFLVVGLELPNQVWFLSSLFVLYQQFKEKGPSSYGPTRQVFFSPTVVVFDKTDKTARHIATFIANSHNLALGQSSLSLSDFVLHKHVLFDFG